MRVSPCASPRLIAVELANLFGTQVPEAQKAYQMLVTLLFKHIDDVAVSNPKYEHIVKLENYHFFAATIRPLKVRRVFRVLSGILGILLLYCNASFQQSSRYCRRRRRRRRGGLQLPTSLNCHRKSRSELLGKRL